MSNPYVATEEGPAWNAGSSELSDIAGLYDDIVVDHNALSSVFDAGGFALDVLGDIGDPLGAVIGCAVGWIVEHVSFLREPVNILAGDPSAIEASTQTWNNVSEGLRSQAEEYVKALNSLTSSWTGDAADAYRRKASEWVDALNGAATTAEVEGALVAATGGMCAAFRGIIFDAISRAIEQWVLVGLVALANSAWTFGASIAGWVLDVEVSAGLLAAKISAKIAKLVEKAGLIAKRLGSEGSTLAKIGDKLIKLSEKMMHSVRSSRAKLGWDRRYRTMTSANDARHDAMHLRESLEGVGKIVPGGVKTVLEQGKNVGNVVLDPDAENIDELANGLGQKGTEQAKEWGDGND